MKKLMMAVAAFGMLLTSCQKEEDLVFSTGETAQVSFSVGTPDMSTRAYSDGLTANVLQYAVYDSEGNILDDLTKTDATINGSATVNLQLTTGDTYSVIFWAAAEDAPYTVDFGAKTMTVDYTDAVSNDETRDAFYKYHTFTVKGAQTETIELKRPFAQLNIGTSDYTASENAGYVPTTSAVTVKNIYTTLSLVDGVVTDETEAVFAANAIPDGEDFPVAGYEYLAMNYLLVNTEKEVVDVEFTYADASNDAKTRTVGSVPVQRNYRTNIYGQLLTSDVDINVIIEPEYDDEDNLELPYVTIGNTRYTTFGEAMAAVQDGETIKLQGGAIELEGVADGNLFTIDGKSITIDLNGYGFVATVPDVTKNSSIFYVAKNSGLTIVGEGNVKVTTNKAPNVLAAFINNDGGTVNLKGGNWTMTALEYPDALIPTFVDNNSNVNSATLNIYDGTYTFHRNLFRNFANAAGHNNYATVATINIYGGTFNGRESDPGAIWNQKPSSDVNIPATAGVINVMGGTFNNVNIDDDFSGVAYVNNNDELTSALNNANTHTVMLGAGKYVASLYPGDIPTRKSLTIIGSEGTQFAYTGSNYAGQFGLAGFDNVTIRNCEILKRENVKDWGMIVFGSSNNPNGVYTFENCIFNGVGTQGIYINENASGATYNILNCTFNGDFGTEGAITIQTNKDVDHIVNVKGCTFNNIPATSHRIYLASYDGTNFYYGWTLKTESKAYSAYDLATLVAMGYTEIDLADGEYDVYGCAGKTLTLNGSNNAVIKLYNDGEDGCDYAFGNGGGVGNITFNGLTIDTQANTGNYKGFAYMKGTFNNCNFVGAYSLNNANDYVFNGCTFDFKNGYFWTWGANSVKFDGCTFNGNSKAILAHGWASTNITIKDCTFAATEQGFTGSGDNTACVEIDPAGTNTYTIDFTGNNTKTSSYAGWTRVKDGSTGHTITGL